MNHSKHHNIVHGPATVNSIPAMAVTWFESGIGSIPHVHFGGQARIEEQAMHRFCRDAGNCSDPKCTSKECQYEQSERSKDCKAEFQCPVCANPNTVAIHHDVNATIWCPVGHITHMGDGVSVAMNGF